MPNTRTSALASASRALLFLLIATAAVLVATPTAAHAEMWPSRGAPALANRADAAQPIAAQPIGDPGDWTLAFDSEFNAASLSKTKWAVLGTAYANNNIRPDPADVSMSGGDLILTLSAAGSGGTYGSGGMISSSPLAGASAGFLLPVGGFMEARIDFPGPGTVPGTSIDNWPTWWADSNGSTWPINGEEDVFEGLGTASSNYHYGSSPGVQSTPINSGPIPGDWSNSFHTYGLYRGATSCTIYYDGKVVDTYQTHDAGSPQQIYLTAGSSTGPQASIKAPSVTGAASAVKVDYVRAWVPAG